MRRRIQLYLGGQAADLPDDALVLFNWATSDAQNPTILRNSFSQSFNLPRTPRNEAIFGHSGRLDRTAGSGGTGAAFNASRKLPFTIYLDTGEVLESGYAKLDSVTDDALAVSLYGGLGELIYNLSYDSAGNKRTLASLDFGGGDAELDFDIDASAVADAWARLGGDTSKPEMWDIINFAPAYNGIPSDFQADKALIDTDLLGIVPPVTMDGVSCNATKGGGYALLTLPQEMDEWQAHDLRSYLQRPVVSVRKILAAIADSNNNGGWSVDLTDLASLSVLDTWLTRPLLPSLGTYKQQPVGASVTLAATGMTSSKTIGRFDLTDVPLGSELNVRVTFRPTYDVPTAGAFSTLATYASSGPGGSTYTMVTFVQAVAYDSANNIVGASGAKMYCRYTAFGFDPMQLPGFLGYVPLGGASVTGVELDHSYAKVSGTLFERTADMTAEVSGVNIDNVEIVVTAYLVKINNNNGGIYDASGGTYPFIYLYSDTTDITSGYLVNAAGILTGSGRATGNTGENLRTGAHITKQMLLSTAHTPAEYLLALCKTFGLLMLTDTAAKKVTILRRKSFYVDETLDLTDRVDTSKGIEITPLSFDAKWYDFRLESVGGRFEKEYQTTEGVQYGIQRVDTGYDFDAETKDLLNGVALKSCAAVQDRGVWWTYAYDSGAARMWVGPVLNAGCTYTLWDTDGANHEANADAPTDAATAIPYNTDFPGYDVGVRAEFRDAENKALDGADCLLWYTGDATPDDFNITDDTAAMDTLTGGPCWLVESNNVGLTIPEFSRYKITSDFVTEALDFGAPREVDIPGLDYPDNVTIYDLGWSAYIRDRLSVHGKILKCRVRFDGLQVGPELLRRFYWYRGSLWMLNKISNYSLTTFDPCECEFIQVRDKDAYIDNQY